MNLLDYAKFQHVTLAIFVPAIGELRIGNKVGYSSIFHTADNARFCLEFVLDVAVRLESAFHVYDIWSDYGIQAKQEAPYYSYGEEGLKEEGKFERGAVVGEARVERLIGQGEFWAWGSEESRRYGKFNSFEIVKERHHTERGKEGPQGTTG